MNSLKLFDLKLHEKYENILAIDEVGRGCVAGPLVICGLILKQDFYCEKIKDSKKIKSISERKKLKEIILKNCIDYKIVEYNPTSITNVKQDTKNGMKSIVLSLKDKFDLCITDFEKIELENLNQLNIKKGDNTSFSIACASIVAKSYRDEIIKKYDEKYPNYLFNSHQGYLTKKHLEIINKFGIIKDIYRKNKKIIKETENKKNFILVIDIGNSYIKMGISNLDKDDFQEVKLFKTNVNLSLQDIISNLKKFKKNNITCSILGSVVPSLKKKFFNAILNVFKIKSYLISKNTKFTFELNKTPKNEVGDDILALSQFCHDVSISKNINVIGFSFGTAISSVCIYNNKLMGAFISIGLSTGLNLLIEKACLIKKQNYRLNYESAFGFDTKTAIEAGLNNIRRGCVLSSFFWAKKNFNSEFYCVLSGGESYDIFEENFQYEVDKHAILKGFKKIYILNN